jgi:hypothetical protein
MANAEGNPKSENAGTRIPSRWRASGASLLSQRTPHVATPDGA